MTKKKSKQELLDVKVRRLIQCRDLAMAFAVSIGASDDLYESLIMELVRWKRDVRGVSKLLDRAATTQSGVDQMKLTERAVARMRSSLKEVV